MKSFVAALACVAVANASVLPAAYAGYGYGAGYAGQPLAAAIAPAAGVYSGLYDPTVAYSRAYPPAEPYVDEEIAAEPYVHVEVPAEPYVDVQVPAEPYIH